MEKCRINEDVIRSWVSFGVRKVGSERFREIWTRNRGVHRWTDLSDDCKKRPVMAHDNPVYELPEVEIDTPLQGSESKEGDGRIQKRGGSGQISFRCTCMIDFTGRQKSNCCLSPI